MCRVRLIHSNAAEAEARGEVLRAAGFEVNHDPLTQAGLQALRTDPPDAVVLDLSRAPSQVRDLALSLRKQKATRHIPLVFVGGEQGKVARIKELLPDATYTTWDAVGGALEHAIACPPAEPVVPTSAFAAYARTPLPQKLGVKPGSTVNLVGAPRGFAETLGELPEGAVLRYEAPSPGGLTLWFVRSRQELVGGIGEMGEFAEGGRLWIVWRKKASGIASDLSQTVVRKTGLDSGLVDFKICSVDATWSGLRFSRRE